MSEDCEGATLHEDVPVTYVRTKASTWTFEYDKVRKWVEGHLEGRVLNLFAGKTKLRHGDEIVRVDINEERDADYHFDAVNVLDYFEPRSFDTVIMDPPFSEIQSRKRYDGEHVGKFNLVRDAVAELVRPGGKTLTFGYHSTGMATTRGFEKEEILLICHGGRFPDTIGTVDRRGERPQDADSCEQMHGAKRDTIGVAERKVRQTLDDVQVRL